MRAVYKHQLNLATEQEVPFGLHQLVHIDVQDGILCAWFEHREGVAQETCKFFIVGTGYRGLKDNWFHLQTVQLDGFVWHVYSEFEDAI